MRAREREEIVKLLLVLFQVGQARPHNEPAQRVRYETNLAQAEVRAVLRDVIIDLLSQSDSHLHDIPLCVLLVSTGAQEHGLWE